MQTTSVTTSDLRSSVIAVPPVARHVDFSLAPGPNALLIDHLHAGGVRTVLYGGNANLYHVALSEYEALLSMLVDVAHEDSLIIPSVGPAYGTMMDQAEILRDFEFPTVMVLPHPGPATPAGVVTGIRKFAERLGRKVIVYLKQDGYLLVDDVKELVADGIVAAVKYAVVRSDPTQDTFLTELVDNVDRSLVVSGIGERPAITHLRDFGLTSFTSGSVCIAPQRSTALLEALLASNWQLAELIRSEFLALEDLRDGINPIRVLHDAVTLAGIADMGPMLPLLSGLGEGEAGLVSVAGKRLLERNEVARAEV